ncbi:SRPBCC family protein [uncultured Mycobacterium sp.]|uniref:SRPBCC family protein n=1 Tax=uncultured Mycobacterium sp. TaxID=171292 RepID=UPI0035C99A32
MPQAEHTVTINRSAEDIFDFLADGENNPKWRPGVLEINANGDTTGVGASYRQVLRGPGGRKIDGDYRVTTYDRPKTLGFQVTAGPVRPVGIFELTPTGSGSTSVTFRLSATPTGFMRLMTPMVAKQIRSETSNIENLKTQLENPV